MEADYQKKSSVRITYHTISVKSINTSPDSLNFQNPGTSLWRKTAFWEEQFLAGYVTAAVLFPCRICFLLAILVFSHMGFMVQKEL